MLFEQLKGLGGPLRTFLGGGITQQGRNTATTDYPSFTPLRSHVGTTTNREEIAQHNSPSYTSM